MEHQAVGNLALELLLLVVIQIPQYFFSKLFSLGLVLQGRLLLTESILPSIIL